MWFAQESESRQMDAGLRVQQTNRAPLHIGCSGWVFKGLSSVLTEIRKRCALPPSITVNRDILYPVKGQIQRINKIWELLESFLTFYF